MVCKYTFVDVGGEERTIVDRAPFKAYLATGGLQHLTGITDDQISKGVKYAEAVRSNAGQVPAAGLAAEESAREGGQDLQRQQASEGEASRAGEEVAQLQAAYDQAKQKLDALGPEPYKPKVRGTNPTPEQAAAFDAAQKAHSSWRRKYSTLKKAEVEASNRLFRAKQSQAEVKKSTSAYGEASRAGEEVSQTAPLWTLTQDEFVAAVRAGRNFPQLGEGIATPLETLRKAKDYEFLDARARRHHAAIVATKAAEGAAVPDRVLSGYPDLRAVSVKKSTSAYGEASRAGEEVTRKSAEYRSPITQKVVLVPNKATAEAIANSKTLKGRATVRKLTKEQIKAGDFELLGYKEGFAVSAGYVIDVTDEVKKSTATGKPSAAYSKDRLRDAMRDALNATSKGIGEAILSKPNVRIINEADHPAAKGAKAFVTDGQVYFVADNISPSDDLAGLAKHEIAVHALQLGKDSAGFQSILSAMRESDSPAVRAAYAAVPENTPEHLRDEEALGYLLEAAPKSTIAQRFMAWLREAIRELGRTLPVLQRAKWFEWANKITPTDLNVMAERALRSGAQGLVMTAPTGGERMASATAGKSATIPRPEIQQKLPQSALESLLQDFDHGGYVFSEDENKWHADNVIAPAVKKLKKAGVSHLDLYHATSADALGFVGVGIRGSEVSEAGDAYGYIRARSVYGMLDPDDFKKGYAGILGAEGDTPTVLHVRVPIDQAWRFEWDANFNVTFGTYSGVRFDGDIPADWISGAYEYDAKEGKFTGKAFDLSLRKYSATLPANIEVDGVMRPTTNSNGLPIAQTVEGVKNFYRWFKGSKVTDAQGRPLVVYHGTKADFNTFNMGDEGGVFFTTSADNASGYAGYWPGIGQSEGGNVMPVYLKIEDPYRTTVKGWNSQEGIDPHGAKAVGFDGFVIQDQDGGDTYIAMYPESQIKSAIGNTGAFSPDTADIRYSLKGTAQAIRTLANIYRQPSAKGFNFFHKTISTSLHKAAVNPDYARVFNEATTFENDVSHLAVKPAELAPNLLPDASNFRAAMATLLPRNRVDSARMDAVARAVFEGTTQGESVYDGKNWTDEELIERFGLDQKGIDLYREFGDMRTRVLQQSAAALAYRTARRYLPEGFDVEATVRNPEQAKQQILDGIRQHLAQLDEQTATPEAIDADTGEVTPAKETPSKTRQNHVTAMGDVTSIFERADRLANAGYAPLMRFGRYAVDVTRGDERIEFRKFETEFEAKKFEVEAREKYPDAKIDRTMMSEKAYELFQGVDPDVVIAFAENVDPAVFGADNEVMQEWYKTALQARSAFKSMIHRKGVAGYDTNLRRISAAFVTSNARMAASAYHMPEIDRLIEDMRERRVAGDVIDEAWELKKYLAATDEPFKALKGVMFAWYLGGSVASAAVNLTQPLMMTLPYLSQFGIGKAKTAMSGAVKAAMSGKIESDDDLADALKLAGEDGKVAPASIHHLYHEGMSSIIDKLPLGKSGRDKAQALATLWGYMFGAAENFNRRLTFIAAYRMAREDKSLGDPYAFAVRAVDETQGIMSKANRPTWARGTGTYGAVGTAAFCVDDTTEALTSEGWKGPDEINPGDMIASFDMETQRLKWAPVDSIYLAPYTGEMVHVNHQQLDMLMTPDHRVVTYRKRRVKGMRKENALFESLEIQEARDLNVRDSIPTSAPFDHTPIGDPISDAMVKVIGWVVTEGYFHKSEGYVCIAQNEGDSANSIRSALKDADIEWTESYWHHKNSIFKHVRFFIRKTQAARIRELIPTKHLTPDILMRMRTDQIRTLVDVMISADGSTHKTTGRKCFIQNAGETLDTFQMALTMLGLSYSVRGRAGSKCFSVLIRNSDAAVYKRTVRSGSKTAVEYTGRVWCPIVPGTATWVARRNGMPFITHNTFKQYSIAYVELLTRMMKSGPNGRKGAAMMMGMLLLASGMQGAPGADDLEDLLDTLLQYGGYEGNTRLSLRRTLVSMVGNDVAQIVQYGLLSQVLPIDIGQRIGLGNLLPGTTLLKPSETNRARQVFEFIGPTGSFAAQVSDALLAGEAGRGLTGIAAAFTPIAIKNAMIGLDMYDTGMYRNAKGYNVQEVSNFDALNKALGFQPASVAEEARPQRLIQMTSDRVKQVQGNINEMYARAIFEQDAALRKKADERVKEWNEDNPKLTIRRNDAVIMKRVKEMRSDKQTRLLKTLPKGMRSMALEELADDEE